MRAKREGGREGRKKHETTEREEPADRQTDRQLVRRRKKEGEREIAFFRLVR